MKSTEPRTKSWARLPRWLPEPRRAKRDPRDYRQIPKCNNIHSPHTCGHHVLGPRRFGRVFLSVPQNSYAQQSGADINLRTKIKYLSDKKEKSTIFVKMKSFIPLLMSSLKDMDQPNPSSDTDVPLTLRILRLDVCLEFENVPPSPGLVP